MRSSNSKLVGPGVGPGIVGGVGKDAPRLGTMPSRISSHRLGMLSGWVVSGWTAVLSRMVADATETWGGGLTDGTIATALAATTATPDITNERAESSMTTPHIWELAWVTVRRH